MVISNLYFLSSLVSVFSVQANKLDHRCLFPFPIILPRPRHFSVAVIQPPPPPSSYSRPILSKVTLISDADNLAPILTRPFPHVSNFHTCTSCHENKPFFYFIFLLLDHFCGGKHRQNKKHLVYLFRDCEKAGWEKVKQTQGILLMAAG